MVTVEVVVNQVADAIASDLEDLEFGDFKEMCECYWWQTKDIREYVEGILKDLYPKMDAYIDEIDHDIVIEESDEICTFRKFMIAVRRQLKALGY